MQSSCLNNIVIQTDNNLYLSVHVSSILHVTPVRICFKRHCQRRYSNDVCCLAKFMDYVIDWLKHATSVQFIKIMCVRVWCVRACMCVTCNFYV